ncbi:uncharacterized protein LOC144106571 [Amblyomma americanum]|uniref:Uncharacterized protein n=1 Tax=Amblyomma americanum TaxID=6943 RepID=A0AAQ4DF49_AMBAM
MMETSKQMSPPGSHEAAAASGNGACSDADHLDDRGSYEILIEEFVRDMRDQSMRQEALRDSSKKQGAENRVDGEKEEEEEERQEELPHRRRRKRRRRFKRLGSVGRPFYRAKVVEEKDPF